MRILSRGEGFVLNGGSPADALRPLLLLLF